MSTTYYHIFQIYKTGLIVQRERLSLTIACPLKTIRSFPFDKETCVIKFESYAYPLSEVKYKWKTFSNGSTITIGRRKRADVNLVQLLPFEKQKSVDGETKSYLRLRILLGNVKINNGFQDKFCIIFFRPANCVLSE